MIYVSTITTANTIIVRSSVLSCTRCSNIFFVTCSYNSKNLSDTDYVKTLYRVFMDREADGAGLSAWINVLESGQSREHVFNGFADSPEFQEICAGYGL